MRRIVILASVLVTTYFILDSTWLLDGGIKTYIGQLYCPYSHTLR